MNLIYTIDASVEEPIMLLNKHVGYDATDGMGIDGSIFQSELLYLDTLGKKRIQIWINSVGGVVTDGYNIYSSILKTNTPVDTYCIGVAASIAAVIFQAGRKRIMADYSWLMFHNPSGGTDDKALKTMKDSLIKMIEQRCGMTEREVELMMARETYIDAPEALKMKLCDVIDQSEGQNVKWLRSEKVDVKNSLSFYQESNKYLNSLQIFNNSKTNNMSITKVTMKLGLNDSAPEDDIVKAITAIENRAKKAEEAVKETEDKAKDKAKADGEELDKFKSEMDKFKAAYEKAKKDFEDCKEKLDAMTKDKKDAEDKAEEDKVKNMVEGFAKIGRIKNDATTILDWTSTAKSLGFEKVKNMIEALPLNKVAAVITEQTVNKLADGVLPTTAVGLAVKNRLKREGKI